MLSAAISAHGLVFSMLLFPPPRKQLKEQPEMTGHEIPHIFIVESEDTEQKNSKQKPNQYQIKALKLLPYGILFVGWFGIILGHIIMISFTAVRARMLGIDKKQAAILLTLLGITAGVPRIFFGWVGDRPSVNRCMMIGVAAMFNGLWSCVSVMFISYPTMMAYSLVFGLGGCKCYMFFLKI